MRSSSFCASRLAGLMTCALALGATAGPLLGTAAVADWGFRRATFGFGVVFWGWAGLCAVATLPSKTREESAAPLCVAAADGGAKGRSYGALKLL